LIPRSQLVVAMIAAFLFGISGGAIGGFAVSTLMQQHQRWDGRPPRGGRHPIMRFEIGGPMARDLERQLDLTPAQSERFRVILMESGPRYAAVRESTRAAMERELTPKQREKFREMEHHFVRYRRLETRTDGRFPKPWQEHRILIESDSIEEGDRR